MSTEFNSISLNCLNPQSQYGWQSVTVKVPKGITCAQLARMVGSERICPYDDFLEHVPPGKGWALTSDEVCPHYSYHVVVSEEVVESLWAHRERRLPLDALLVP